MPCGSGFSRELLAAFPKMQRLAAEAAPTGGFFLEGGLFPAGHHHYAPSRCSFRICASTATIAVMLTTRRGVAALVRMWAGWSVPIRIGPMATPSVITLIRL